MKKTALFGLMAPLLSCKKQANTTLDTSNNIKSVVLNLTNTESLTAFTAEQSKSLIDYLDHASAADRQLISDKLYSLKSLHSQNEPTSTNPGHDIKTTTGTSGSVDPQLFSIIVLSNSNGPGDNWVESGNAGSYIPFTYNWTMAKQITNIFRVISKEDAEVVDQGSSRTPDVRYCIQSLRHMSSYILGYAPGIGWTENNHADPQYNPGGYYAYLMTSGVLDAIGFHREITSSQYVNMSSAYASGGNTIQ